MKLGLPESVRQAVSSSVVASHDLAWYRDFDDALKVAPGVTAMWLRPADVTLSQGTDLISRATSLVWLHVSRVGVEILPLAEMARRNIALTNGAGLTSDAIAEHVVMCMFALRRGLPRLLRAQAEASWRPEAGLGGRLENSVVLVIGYGHVGTAVVKRAGALGMQVKVVRRQQSVDDGAIVAGDDWRELLPGVDFLVLAVPLTGTSRNLIGRNELARLKASAVVISVARGEILDVDYLAQLIRDGRLGGAALDCFEEEPLPLSSPLWELPNTIITPHIAWMDSGFMPRELQLFEDNFQRFVRGDDLRNVVDTRAGY